ncbi:hypothetical protein T492DRAFT_870854 [Pavlovales sp. CCMP2436]|nr:hypothetical protein T492DRAFT_870854 [Pavlovales sp. CCMP2436]
MQPAENVSASLFVRRISLRGTSSDFRELFSPFGKLAKVSLPGKPSGFGFVEFASVESASLAKPQLGAGPKGAQPFPRPQPQPQPALSQRIMCRFGFVAAQVPFLHGELDRAECPTGGLPNDGPRLACGLEPSPLAPAGQGFGASVGQQAIGDTPRPRLAGAKPAPFDQPARPQLPQGTQLPEHTDPERSASPSAQPPGAQPPSAQPPERTDPERTDLERRDPERADPPSAQPLSAQTPSAQPQTAPLPAAGPLTERTNEPDLRSWMRPYVADELKRNPWLDGNRIILDYAIPLQPFSKNKRPLSPCREMAAAFHARQRLG